MNKEELAYDFPGVAESAKYIAENADHVSIPNEGVDRVANAIVGVMKNKTYNIKSWKEHELHPSVMDEDALKWVFVIDTLNFSFWAETSTLFTVKFNEKCYTGYWSLCAAINRALQEGIPITDPKYYATVDRETLAKVFRSETSEAVSMLDERVKNLNEVGRVLLEKYEGSVVKFVESCENSAQKLLRKVACNFPCFRDEAQYKGKKVSIYKRAQILVADIWGCFEGKGYGCFDDIDTLTMFADYRVPQVLLYFDALKYSQELMDILKGASDTKLCVGNPIETEIRGCSIHSVELIRKRVMEIYPEYTQKTVDSFHLNSILIDFYLWDYAKEHQSKMHHLPIHKLRTIFY
eukprot:Nk52_evm55s343 gene=Nk52_evmTU55s343